MHPTTAEPSESLLLEQITAQIRTFLGWAQADARTLTELEHQLMPVLHTVGQAMLSAAAHHQEDRVRPSSVPCACGAQAQHLRRRPATVITLVGRMTFTRAYYHCAACHVGQHPLDQQLQVRAGSRSAALDDVIARLGVTQGSFAQAAAMLETLTLVQLSPSTIRTATHAVGQQLLTNRAAEVAFAQAGHDPAAPTHAPRRLYLSMDGILINTRTDGWREVKVGCCFTTTVPRHQRVLPLAQQTPHATELSYITTLAEAHDFGWVLWHEALARGAATAEEVIILGDGAHWIWNLAETLFPQATQILDWYHASSYLRQVGMERWASDVVARQAWVEAQLTVLWAGQVAQVLTTLAALSAPGEAVAAAISYYTTHQQRMDYAAYRARGLQVGSGSIESGCKQVVAARLKQAGMRWSTNGAERVAAVRAEERSGRWAAVMAQQIWQPRGYQRQPGPAASPPAVQEPPSPTPVTPQAAADAAKVAAVRAELAAEQATHPWKQAWSRKRREEQRREALATAVRPAPSSA